MRTFHSKRQAKGFVAQAGFSLVEIMVGLVIGLLATLVVMRVFSLFDTQRRVTMGAADSQVNGNIAFHTVASNLQMAGFGIMPDSAYDNFSMLKCGNLAYRDINILGGVEPVVIADGVSDTITVRFGSAEAGGALVSIVEAPVGSTLPVSSNFGCYKDDHVYITTKVGGTCALARIKEVRDPSPTQVFPEIELMDDTAVTMGVAEKQSRLACLGKWTSITYYVKDNTLYGNVDPVVAEIVNIQAQYGISAVPSSNDVTEWVDATGPWANPTVQDRNRIKAVHIAFVARNPQRSTEVVTTDCSSLTAAEPTGLCAWDASTVAGGSAAPRIDLSADKDWNHYRYQVFEAVVPIRNSVRASLAFP